MSFCDHMCVCGHQDRNMRAFYYFKSLANTELPGELVTN